MVLCLFLSLACFVISFGNAMQFVEDVRSQDHNLNDWVIALPMLGSMWWFMIGAHWLHEALKP